jgi:hypothetical protein
LRPLSGQIKPKTCLQDPIPTGGNFEVTQQLQASKHKDKNTWRRRARKNLYCGSMVVARTVYMNKEFFDFDKETNYIMKIGKW